MNVLAQPFVALPRAKIVSLPDQPGGSTERQLLAAAERAGRHRQSLLGIVLHLSRLCPPAPRQHHLRIARALMHDVADRHNGQTFALSNRDIVVLCRRDEQRSPFADSSLAEMSETLSRLFRYDAADAAALVTFWPLPQHCQQLLDYAATRLADSGAPETAEEAAAPVPELSNALDILAGSKTDVLLQRQTAVMLATARSPEMGISSRIRPIYQEFRLSADLIAARLGASDPAGPDPHLLQHISGRLAGRMLAMLREKCASGGLLDPVARPGMALHVATSIQGLLSADLATVATTFRRAGHAFAGSVPLSEAGADPAGFNRALNRAVELGIEVVLDGVSYLALLLARPGALRAHWAKFEWSPRLLVLPAPEQTSIAEAIREIGPARLILNRAETEGAIRWGLKHGIRRFQGLHVDTMLAAQRIVACRLSAACSLRQCTERAVAIGGAGRASCGNHTLLDAGGPLPPGDEWPT